MSRDTAEEEPYSLAQIRHRTCRCCISAPAGGNLYLRLMSKCTKPLLHSGTSGRLAEREAEKTSATQLAPKEEDVPEKKQLFSIF